MNKILPIVLLSLGVLVAQTDAEIKQAKEVIKKGADRIVLETVVQKDFENFLFQ